MRLQQNNETDGQTAQKFLPLATCCVGGGGWLKIISLDDWYAFLDLFTFLFPKDHSFIFRYISSLYEPSEEKKSSFESKISKWPNDLAH